KAIRKEGGRPRLSPLQGWLATASSSAGAASHGQPPCKAGRPRTCRLRPRPPARGWLATAKAPCRGSRQHAQPPVGMAGACGRRQRPQLGHKGQPPAARPEWAAARCEARKGNPMAKATACKGDRSCRGSARARWHRPPARCRPRAAAPAHADSVQRRRLQRAMTAMAQ
ncbi:hypothetical protein GW17_00055490, partial [Ensete ventricosum]